MSRSRTDCLPGHPYPYSIAALFFTSSCLCPYCWLIGSSSSLRRRELVEVLLRSEARLVSARKVLLTREHVQRGCFEIMAIPCLMPVCRAISIDAKARILLVTSSPILRRRSMIHRLRTHGIAPLGTYARSVALAPRRGIGPCGMWSRVSGIVSCSVSYWSIPTTCPLVIAYADEGRSGDICMFDRLLRDRGAMVFHYSRSFPGVAGVNSYY